MNTLKLTFSITGVLAALIVFCTLSPAKAEEAALSLTQNGQSKYVIVLASDAIPAERTAANELQDYVQKISGARLAIRNENEVLQAAPQILIGSGKRVKSLLPKQNWEALGTDGVMLKTSGQNLILAGGRPRGALYAVYTLLEDHFGVRWWTPKASEVPKRPSLTLPSLDTVYSPQLASRDVYHATVASGRKDLPFATRLKLNGHHQAQGAEWGGSNVILGWVEPISYILPPEKYFKDHPEWYSDLDNGGKPSTAASRMPQGQHWQPCLSNEALRLEVTKNVREWLRANPGMRTVAIQQNDSYTRCTCEADTEQERIDGSPSGPLVRFVNTIAADLQKDFPGVKVQTFAYNYTQKPPLVTRPSQNVIIRLCSAQVDASLPLSSDGNATFRDDLLQWRKIAPHLTMWNYVTNFSNYITPFANLNQLGPDIRFLAQNGVEGLFQQGDAWNDVGDFLDLRLYVMAHMMWKPELDQKQLEDEFLSGYYGAAAPHLRAYLDLIQEAAKGRKLTMYETLFPYYNLDVMNRATQEFERASAAVAGDEVLATRVRLERLALDHMWLLRSQSLQREAQTRKVAWRGPTDINALANEFVQVAQANGVVRSSEGEPFPAYVTRFMERFRPPVELPEFAQGRLESDVVDVQEGAYEFIGLYDWVSVLDDPKASNGRAAKLAGATNQWALKYFLEDDDFLTPGPWHCYIVARVQPKENAAPDGVGFAYGIYDGKNRKEVVTINTPLADVGSDEYQTFDMGVHRLDSGMMFWAAGPKRDDIDGVYVDRIILVREAAK